MSEEWIFIIGVLTGLFVGAFLGILLMDIWRDHRE